MMIKYIIAGVLVTSNNASVSVYNRERTETLVEKLVGLEFQDYNDVISSKIRELCAQESVLVHDYMQKNLERIESARARGQEDLRPWLEWWPLWDDFHVPDSVPKISIPDTREDCGLLNGYSISRMDMVAQRAILEIAQGVLRRYHVSASAFRDIVEM